MLDSRAATSKRSNLPQVGCGDWRNQAPVRKCPLAGRRSFLPLSFSLTSSERFTAESLTYCTIISDSADCGELMGKTV
jgi:hypothetical protein